MDAKEDPMSLDTLESVITYAECYNKYKSLLSRASVSKEEFEREYRQFCDTESKEKGFYLVILDELKIAVLTSDINTFKRLDNFIAYINDIANKSKLKDFCNSTDNPLRNTNLVILACKYNEVEILKHIFSSSKILNNLSLDIGRNAICFNDKDEACHNAFYYSVRSNNVELLDTLINKWPDDYLATHSLQLDETLSSVYEEIKLKNIPLSDEIEIYIENKLLELRFFSDDLTESQTVNNTCDDIKERIDLVIENVSSLETDYSGARRVDERFLFLIKCVAQNINILKQQLRSTYNKIPWEEMEFCLTSYISSHVKRQEINLFYRAALNKRKVLGYLKIFAKVLKNDGVLVLSTDLPKEKREEIVPKIINIYPELKELYADYRQIRDVYSLQKMDDYIKLALSVDTKRREGQLVILRVLEIFGDCLKNTLEFPKLSANTSKLLLLTLPETSREVIMDLWNSPSHAYSLARRIKLENNTDMRFFTDFQDDIKMVSVTINDILHEKRILVMKTLLENIISSEALDEIAEMAEAFTNSNLNLTSEDLETLERDKLEMLVNELSDSIQNKSEFERMLLHNILNIIGMSMNKDGNTQRNDWIPFHMLKCGSLLLSTNNNVDNNIVRNIKYHAKEASKNIILPIESRKLNDIVQLSQMVFFSAQSRLEQNDLNEIKRIVDHISYFTKYGMSDIAWVDGLGGKLIGRSSFIRVRKQEERYYNLLTLKLSELKNILTDNLLMNNLIENLSSYKNNKSLQSMIEILVLDILSILDSSKNYLENNLFFLDDYFPLLTGKCLRDHLAHDNATVNVLLSNPSIMVVLNAKKLVSEDIMKRVKNLGKSTRVDCSKLRSRYSQSLIYIANQERMFAALEEGRLEELKSCLQAGADIHGRNINLWTALHFAAKGSNLEVVKFVLNHDLDINVTDVDGQSPLHIAAASGRTNIVKFFIETMGFKVDVEDNNKKTPLHVATENNRQDTVEFLLLSKANIDMQDTGGNIPLHYAIRNNCIDIVKILMQGNTNINVNVKNGLEFTPLHIAAELGYIELVNFFLDNEADVKAKNDKYATPLHLAALNGHIGVVKVLLSKRADVNAGDNEGLTPLHYAVRNDQKTIAKILLTYESDPNAGDKLYNNTPFHYAAMFGHTEILQLLLENGANAYIPTFMHLTPLHFAAQGGHLKVINILINDGIYVHAKDGFGATALYYAASRGHKEIVNVLLKNKANANVKTFCGFTPLHAAVEAKQKKIINSLIRYKARINSKNNRGMTPLHIAAGTPGNKYVIKLLLERNATIDIKDNYWMTPLHMAASVGCVSNVSLLIKHKAPVNAKSKNYETPLYLAVSNGHKEVVTFLIEHNADVNIRSCTRTLLDLAVENGDNEIVQILLANGIVFNNDCIELVCTAIRFNYKEIIESLLIASRADFRSQLQNSAAFEEALEDAIMVGNIEIVETIVQLTNETVNGKYPDGRTILHVAVKTGRLDIVDTLISKGANVNAASICNITPLHVAAENGYDEVVESLITNGANINVKSTAGNFPLCLAAEKGHYRIVEILLDNGATIDDKDGKNRTPLEMATANGHLEVVKTLLLHKKVDLNTVYNDSTLLHMASQIPNLELVKYLVDEGANIHAINSFHTKPIHLAANKDIAEYFVRKGSTVNELDISDKTPLHYATQKCRLEVVKYLIEQGADVNARSNMGTSPLHNAAATNCSDIVKFLLKNGAVYNATDMSNRLPLEMTTDQRTAELLIVIWRFFEAVKHNNVVKTEEYIIIGAPVNARDANDLTALHYAAWKGYCTLVKSLLANAANSNALSNGLTPLHYAAKYSHLSVVNDLLSNSAIYNVISVDGKTPLDLATDEDIIYLLTLISRLFEKVKNNDSGVLLELNRIGNLETIKAVMNACNEENETLIFAAIHSNFSKVQSLKEVPQSITTMVYIGEFMLDQRICLLALLLFKIAYKKRLNILGPKNPSTLDAQICIARTLFEQGAYEEALTMFKEIFQKQNETLGSHDEITLKTRSMIAWTLYNLTRNEEALHIYREVSQKQEEILGPNHQDTMNVQFQTARVLDKLRRYDEAVDIYRKVFEGKEIELGLNDAFILAAQNNIAVTLTNQGKTEEALKIHNEILNTVRNIYDVSHVANIETLHNIACVLFQQNRHQEALNSYQEILNIQETVFGPNHRKTLVAHHDMINLLIKHGKLIGALVASMKVLHRMEAAFPPCHPILKGTKEYIESFKYDFTFDRPHLSRLINYMMDNINNGAINNKLEMIELRFKQELDLNDKDIEGLTPLHYAASNGHINVVGFLLKNAADIDVTSIEGNTPLHAATTNGHKNIVQLLLQHISHDKLSNFINAKTTTTGTASLHIAATNGSLDIVCCLLGYGAIYNIKNKEGKTPYNLSKNQSIVNLLQLIEELFKDAKNGNTEIVRKLSLLKESKPNQFVAATNARNKQMHTLLQVAISNGHKNVASELSKILK